MKISEAYNQISNEKFKEIRQKKYDFLKLLETYEKNTLEDMSLFFDPRTLVEVTGKLFWMHISRINLGKKMFKTKYNNEQEKLNKSRVSNQDYEKNIFELCKRIGSRYEKKISNEIIFLYKYFSKESHTINATPIEDITRVFVLMKNSISLIKTSINNIEINDILKEKNLTSPPLPVLDEIKITKIDSKFKIVKGWIKSISTEINPFTKIEGKLLVISPFRRGKNAPNRQTISLFVDGDFTAYEGLTYQFKLDVSSKNNIKLIKFDKWEKPELILQFIQELCNVNDKVDMSFFLKNFSSPHKTIPGFTDTRLIVKNIEKNLKTQAYNSLKEIDSLIIEKKIHFSKIFTSFGPEILDIISQISKNISFLDYESGFDLMTEKIRIIQNIRNLYFIELLWSKKPILTFLNPNSKEGIRTKWEHLHDINYLRNPARTRVTYELLLKSRLTNSDFMNKNIDEIIINLFERSMEIYLSKNSSSIIYPHEIMKILYAIYNEFSKLGWTQNIEEITAGQIETDELISFKKLYNKTLDVSNKIKELFDEENNESTLLFIMEKSKYIKEINIDDNTYLCSTHEDSSFSKEKKLAEMLIPWFKKETLHVNRRMEIVGLIQENNFEINESQVRAIQQLEDNKISILIGKAGTGKTTVVSLYVKFFIQNNPSANVMILSPTGAAGNVIRTNLRKMGIKMNNIIIDTAASSARFKTKQTSLLIFEESSMMNLWQIESAISNLNANASIVFLGDGGQLPSIGLGNILKEFSKAKISKDIILLEKNYRQDGNMISEFLVISQFISCFNGIREQIIYYFLIISYSLLGFILVLFRRPTIRCYERSIRPSYQMVLPEMTNFFHYWVGSIAKVFFVSSKGVVLP